MKQVFYYHSLIVRWIAGVGKGASVSVQGLLMVALSAGKDLAYAGGILRYAQNDRAGHYQVLGLDGQLKDPVSVAGMGFCGFDHYGKGPRGSAHCGPVVLGPGVWGDGWAVSGWRGAGAEGLSPWDVSECGGGRTTVRPNGEGRSGGPIVVRRTRKEGARPVAQGKGVKPSPRTGQRLKGRNRRPRPGPPSLPGGFATGRAPRRRWGTRGHRR